MDAESRCKETLKSIIDPTLDDLAVHIGQPNDRARVMLLAIGLQESLLIHRYQIVSGGGKGPARGLWQFEKGGGVKGVLTHRSSSKTASIFAAYYSVSTDASVVWAALETSDKLACAFARLLLLTDPKTLPEADFLAQQEAWAYYLRNWRPGKPHPDAWKGNWQLAVKAVKLLKQ